MTDGPLIVQSDKTVLLEVDHEQAGAARAAIAPFAELERAPEHVHTYRITPLALWNARAAGHDTKGTVLGSDAFFPFRDGVDQAAEAGVRAIVQPGGSVKDPEVIAAADEHGIAMVFTGRRTFRH